MTKSLLWKAVPGYEGVYRISSEGRIQRWFRKYKRWSKDLKLVKQSNGYLKCHLSLNSKVTSYWVHILVAKTFLGHTPNGNTLVVHHRDEVRDNNKVDNLEVISNRENIIKGFKSRGTVSGITGVLKTKSGKFQAIFQKKCGHIKFKPEVCPLVASTQYVLATLDNKNN